MRTVNLWVCFLLFIALAGNANAATRTGETVYAENCASCHSSGSPRTPTLANLKKLATGRIVGALESGVMRVIGTFELNGPERVAVAEYITGTTYDENWRGAGVNTCADTAWPGPEPFGRPHWNGWGGSLANTRFQPAANAGLERDDVARLELQWAFALPGETFTESQATIVAGRLFVGSPSGTVYALDAKTGCTAWTFTANAGIKAPVTIGTLGDPARHVAYFGDQSGEIYALDAATGELLWQQTGDEHASARVTGGIQFFEGRVYVPMSSLEELLTVVPGYVCCVFRGSVGAYDGATGKRLWKHYMITAEPVTKTTDEAGNPMLGPSGASVWSAVTIDAKLRRVYVGTGDNYSNPTTDTSDAIVALSLDTGERLWVYQGLGGDAWNIGCGLESKYGCPKDSGPDEDMGASPILIERGDGRRILIGAQKSGVVHALDPDRDGKVLWQRKVAEGGVQGGLQWGQASDGRYLYAARSDLNWLDAGVYGPEPKVDPNKGGGLMALDLDDGEIVWEVPPVSCAGREQCSPAQTQAVTAIPGVVFSGSQSGEMRAFDTATGTQLWHFDSAREYATVNGAVGYGGSIDQAGTVIVDGMVYFNPGYSKWGARGGNVILAFKPAAP
jgi:polyvinyl alcohol dehydrogenase (cytochrome)